MTDILAIDAATITGWARGIVGSAPEHGTVNFGRADTGDKVFASCLAWISHELELSLPDQIFIEAMLPPQAMKGHTSRQVRDRLAGLHGVVRAVACKHNILVTAVSVGDIRAHFIGARGQGRNVAKTNVIERCRALGWNVRNDNEADAVALWSYACALIDPKSALQVVPLFNKKLRVTTWP